MNFDFAYVVEIFPQLLDGAIVTVEATCGGMAVAIVIGLMVAIGRIAGPPVVAIILTGYVQLARCTPLLVQLFFLFYVLPEYGLILSGLVTGIIGLGLHTAAYASEVYRAAILSVPKAQWDATVALNMPSRKVWQRIIIPQTFPVVLPVMANYFISLLKESALLATITVRELLGAGLYEGSITYKYTEVIMAVGLIYFVLSSIGGVVAWRLERRVSPA